jgi:phage terminase small subunit
MATRREQQLRRELKEARFAVEYVIDRNATAAAIRAGFSPRSAYTIGSDLLKKVDVLALIESSEAKTREQLQLDADDITRMWSQIATLDRNDLAEIRRVACRYCYGIDHRYQETPAERERRHGAHQLLLAQTPEKDWAKVPLFDELGGLGYSRKRDPHPDCPECDGFGVEHVLLKDTRKLSPEAKAVYEGIDIKNGAIVVKMHSREAALNALAKRLGIDGSGTPPAAPAADAIPDDPIEASRIYQRLTEGG